MDSGFYTRDSKRSSKDIKHWMKYLRWSTELLATWFGKGRRRVLRTLRGGANQLLDCLVHDGSNSEILRVCDGCNIIHQQSFLSEKNICKCYLERFLLNSNKIILRSYSILFFGHSIFFFSKGLLTSKKKPRAYTLEDWVLVSPIDAGRVAKLLGQVSMFRFLYFKYHSCYNGSSNSFHC